MQDDEKKPEEPPTLHFTYKPWPQKATPPPPPRNPGAQADPRHQDRPDRAEAGTKCTDFGLACWGVLFATPCMRPFSAFSTRAWHPSGMFTASKVPEPQRA